MKHLIILLVVICVLSGCGSRHIVNSINLIVNNDVGLFQTDADVLRDSIIYKLNERLSKDQKYLIIEENGARLVVSFLSDKVQYNRNWIVGNSYSRTVVYKLKYGDMDQECEVVVDVRKEGAIDRFVGSVTGMGSNPGKVILPGSIDAIIGEVIEEIIQRIQFPDAYNKAMQRST